MTLTELDELLELREWSKTYLAAALEMSEAGVHRWYRDGEIPKGPANVLLRRWLQEARDEKKTRPRALAGAKS